MSVDLPNQPDIPPVPTTPEQTLENFRRAFDLFDRLFKSLDTFEEFIEHKLYCATGGQGLWRLYPPLGIGSPVLFLNCPGKDLLDEAITQFHQEGISVIPRLNL